MHHRIEAESVSKKILEDFDYPFRTKLGSERCRFVKMALWRLRRNHLSGVPLPIPQWGKMAEIEGQISNAPQPFSAFALQTLAMATSFSGENNLAEVRGDISNRANNAVGSKNKSAEKWRTCWDKVRTFWMIFSKTWKTGKQF